MFLLCFLLPFRIFSQTQVSNEFEKGYVKDGLKYSMWEYYTIDGELELKINHSTGKVYFLKEDTSKYVIRKNGDWVEEQLRIYPIPIDGYYNLHNKLKRNIRYPLEARRAGIDGEVLVMFEVDTAGVPTNYFLLKDIGGGCGEEAIRVLQQK